jgi:hypothetical protein
MAMQDRTWERKRWAAVGLALLACAAGSSWAGTQCGPSDQPGIERCVSGLPADSLLRMQQSQRASNWCWAAGISMVLRRYGVLVPQDDVVRAQFGSPDNVAADATAITGLLNRTWRDAAGRSLSASAAPVPRWRRHLGLVAPEVIADLDQDRPLLLGARQHATVLVQVIYERAIDPDLASRQGTRLVRAVVLDPSGDMAVRSARGAELQPDVLTRVEVQADEAATAMAAVQPRRPPGAATLLAQGSTAAAPTDSR